MSPTQAQIEAFRKAMPSWWQRGAAQKKEETEEIVRCLTAAAEVGNKEKALMANGLDALASIGIDGHAAAVQIGKETMAKLIGCEKKLSTTIERCAQVADATVTDDNSWADGRARNIAAAIRALKEDK